MADSDWLLSDSSGDWLLSDGSGSWLIELDGGAPVATGGGKSRTHHRPLFKPKTKTIVELEQVFFKRKFIIRPILTKQFFKNIKLTPVYFLITHIPLKARIFTSKKSEYRAKIKFTGIYSAQYTLCFVAKIFKERLIKKRYMKIARVMHTNFYKTIIGKQYRGLEMILKGLATIKKEIIPNNPKILSFTFNEPREEWRDVFNADINFFDQASSFIGTVQYDTEKQQLFIEMNGTTYVYCFVPEFIFTEFRDGRRSKGKYFNEVINHRFQC